VLIRTGLVAGLMVGWCVPAAGQRLLAVTSTMSASREAAGVYLHSVDWGRGEILTGGEHLPGTAALGSLTLSPDARRAWLSTGPPGSSERRKGVPQSYVSGFHTAPFKPVPRTAPAAEPSVREWVAASFENPLTNELNVVLLGRRQGENGAWQGWIEARPERTDEDIPAIHIDLPGVPVVLTPLGDPGHYAVLCQQDSEDAPALLAVDAVHGGCRLTTAGNEAAANEMEGVAAGMALSGNGTRLFVMTSGFALQRAEAEAVSWVYVFDTTRWERIGGGIELPGTNHGENVALHAAGEDACWAATRVPGSDFASATRLRAPTGEEPLRKEAEYPLTGVNEQFHLAPDPDGVDVAAAVENRIEIWPGGERTGPGARYEDPIQVLRWTQEGLFAGEGGRLHVVDTSTGESLAVIQFQSGWVTDLALLPADSLPQPDADADGLTDHEERRLGTSATSPDTDADGIADGGDPEPRLRSPRLSLPAEILFHGEAVGREVRALRICPREGLDPAWRISLDEIKTPWLLLHPRSGQGDRPLYIGIDPARFTPGVPAFGTIRVDLDGMRPGQRAAGSPAEVQVRVLPAQGGPQQILWVWADSAAAPVRGKSEGDKLGGLANLLAGPPLYFAQRETAGPFQEPLEPYTVVVLEAAAAAQGALTRQAALDYVSRGGSLLFLGSHLDGPANPALSNWLSPLGIRINTSVLVEGRYAAAGEARVVRHWRDFRVAGGCAISAEEGYALEPGGTEGVGAVFVAREYGYGRIALLSAPTPLETMALEGEKERRFALELFRWLARARYEISDLDGDGLPDATEDPKGLRVVNPGETDYLNPDSDADGIPDGLEDANRNGRVDDGETDPRNPDSDGDGIWDGADTSPCPIFGAPHIASVEPSSGPAEGGTVTVISGRNFSPDSAFWFGENKVLWSRVANPALALVGTPGFDQDSGGLVTVRAASAGGTLEGSLPGGFSYTARSQVHVELQAGRIMVKTEGDVGGVITAWLPKPNHLPVGRMVLTLQAEPSTDFRWGEIREGTGAARADFTARGRAINDSTLLVMISGGKPGPNLDGILFEASWRSGLSPNRTIEVRAVQSWAITRHAGRLGIAVKPVKLQLGSEGD
jgi:hypothetical protein